MPPPGPAGPVPLVCPSCHAPVGASDRFCPSCGGPLPAPSAAGSPSSAPVDLREKVDQDRGTLKRLQLLVPGFRAYRQGEDIRAADSILRRQVADKIKNARTSAENARAVLTQSGQFSVLMGLAPLISDLLTLEPKIRSAEQGYSGISPATRVGNADLDRLYEYDYGFVLAGDQLDQTLAPLPTLAAGANAADLQRLVATARGQVSQLQQAFQVRLKAIQGILVQ
ncbi:MAG: zinc ribbon domain-containing protein [Thermoplasmata archaeon]